MICVGSKKYTCGGTAAMPAATYTLYTDEMGADSSGDLVANMYQKVSNVEDESDSPFTHDGTTLTLSYGVYMISGSVVFTMPEVNESINTTVDVDLYFFGRPGHGCRLSASIDVNGEPSGNRYVINLPSTVITVDADEEFPQESATGTISMYVGSCYPMTVKRPDDDLPGTFISIVKLS